MYKTKIDRLVSAYIAEKGLTQAKLADSIGVSRKTLSNARSGRGLTLDSAFLISSRLGLTLDEFYQLTR